MKKRNYLWTGILCVGVLMVIVCCQNFKAAGNVSIWQEIKAQLEGGLYMEVLKAHIPIVTAATEENGKAAGEMTLQEIFVEKLGDLFPIQEYVSNMSEYDTQIESSLSYEMLMAREGVDEQYRNGELVAEAETLEEKNGDKLKEGADGQQPENASQETANAVTAPSVTEPIVQISREKLNDFDYLIQNFYTVDRTTTIDGTQLNAAELLAKDMHLTTASEQPQILIHHTHSQEEYVGSTGDAATSIVGVGEYLAQLLREKYGFNVIHDTGEYDVIDHDNAYSYAGPAVEQILAENPSIEVVIDVHRDGIGSGHLVSEVNGKQTAQIMFFNGLSRTTDNGNLDYLYNPNLSDNLAFSLQLKIAAEEYYPGFARANYLKGYRYNLHYRPKSLLVEVGAQTNTVEEAMNAMEPLADLLHKVLAP